ncbi:MAG: glycoside hydrolase family 2 TIM barrel-domain containing protein [Nitrososphaerota archaeon]|nr:beta galactosidase jelly roll domain-containing protein [Candidatus Bathyarchaeota archaeon]MDW8049315.1 glycoside hydrolase family 2 TIM barrel-domain containing protein [Nitrososphaerota archaeon]
MSYEERFIRERIDLSGFWYFRVDPRDAGELEKWFEERDLRGWDKLYVPASWNEQDSAYTWYMGVAWYAREFYVPGDWKDKVVSLCFEGVNYKAKVWVNGVFLGEHEGGFTPFSFRVEGALRIGGDNILFVRVDNTLSKRTIPPGEGMNQTYFDFFHYGGIHREVYLTCLPRLYIKDVILRTDIKNGDGLVDADVSFVNETAERYFCKLMLEVFDGPEIAAQKPVRFIIGPNSEKVVNEKVVIKAAKLWSPESPHLYRFRVTVSHDEGICDTYEERFGVRTIRVEGGRILLNGRPVFLKGCARHEDFPIMGKALPGAVLRKDFGLMKEIGCNSFRTSHYPYSRAHLDLADEYGFMVILEMPMVGLCRHIERLDDPELMEKMKRMTREAIERDRNRPSVIMYSLFNEPDSDREEFRTLLKEVAEEARKADPTRPITFVSYRHLEDKALDMVDVLCHNFYYGWYNLCGELDKAEKMLSETLDEIHRRFPDKPIIVTEFGADAIVGVHRNPPEMWSEEYQAELIKTYWKVLRSKPYVVGGHIWNFADFRVGQSPRRTTLNRKGIFTRTREPKLSVNVVKELFQKTPTFL